MRFWSCRGKEHWLLPLDCSLLFDTTSLSLIKKKTLNFWEDICVGFVMFPFKGFFLSRKKYKVLRNTSLWTSWHFCKHILCENRRVHEHLSKGLIFALQKGCSFFLKKLQENKIGIDTFKTFSRFFVVFAMHCSKVWFGP